MSRRQRRKAERATAPPPVPPPIDFPRDIPLVCGNYRCPNRLDAGHSADATPQATASATLASSDPTTRPQQPLHPPLTPGGQCYVIVPLEEDLLCGHCKSELGPFEPMVYCSNQCFRSGSYWELVFPGRHERDRKQPYLMVQDECNGCGRGIFDDLEVHVFREVPEDYVPLPPGAMSSSSTKDTKDGDGGKNEEKEEEEEGSSSSSSSSKRHKTDDARDDA